MATRELARFFSDYLALQPAVRTQLEAIADDAKLASALVEHGRRAGFEFNEREVLDVMKASPAALSDAELERVAGGVTWDPDPNQRVRYLEFKLKTVLISG